MRKFSSAKKAKLDLVPLLGQRGNSSVRSAIDRLAKILEKRNDAGDELLRFLSREKGFRSEQCESDLSLLHYLAGREFETAKEADDWLRFAVEQKNQSIEKEAGVRRFRPLHCACEWGDIFGVEWLVSHHANVKAKDILGRTPYTLASLSSVYARKKMIYLEEHGYILSSSDLVWAAQNQFSSSEEVDRIFHHLVYEKGLSINDIDWERNTPLHSACSSGSIFVVKWLIEHRANINSVKKWDTTPFMDACESSINRSAKVRYLDEKGADCLAKDHDGKTALFYSTWTSECNDDEVKDVLRYLVIEKGIDINSVEKFGGTPLMYACYHHPSFVVIQLLLELGADVSARDKNEKNALHMAVQSYSKLDKSIIDLLIEKGCDVTCQDKNGKTPYELADGERRAFLRQHYDFARFSVLNQEEMVRPDSIKFCVVGSEMAGKTTLVNSLLLLGLPPPKEEDRTPGVEIHNRYIAGVGKGSMWDFGAQPTFHSAHGLFFRSSSTIFALVLRFRDGQQMTSEIVLLEIGRYWCAFLKAALRTLSPNRTSRLRLFIIFNLIDSGEDAGIEVSFQLKRIAETLQNEFDDTFEILHVFEMDCSIWSSLRMKDFRQKLRAIHKKMLEEADEVPKLCHIIEEKICLPDKERKSPLRNFMTSELFLKWVVEDVGITLNENQKKVSVEYLDSTGVIVNLGPQICLRPQWLCHNVVGPLLAPPYFPFGMPSQKSGEVSLKDIELALKAFEDDLKKRGTPSSNTVTVEEAIQVLLCLDLCTEVEKSPEKKYQIPALLQHSIRRDAWIEDAMFDVYRGQRYECSLSVDIISPSSFVVFQSRCSRMNKPTRREAWKDGVKLVRIVDDKVVESRIELGIKKSHCCIDIVLRWSSKRACEEVAKEFMTEIKDMIMRACDERSPGVILNWFYLDSKHLKQLDEDPAIYSMVDVEKKVKQQAFDHVLFSVRPENGQHSAVRDLYIPKEKISLSPRAGEMRQDNRTKEDADSHVAALSVTNTFPADEEFVSEDLMKTCAAFKGSKWEDLGCLLVGLEKIKDIRKPYGGNLVHMLEVLEAWNTEKPRTVGQLLTAFEAVGVNRSLIKKKYEELRGTVLK
ncbi:death-associated protein kinase 1-like [Oscarella lobularis]|uniref:death-associated protein kinase 1-like n=1 Tax=Oscarella lobularis TaxID=121494 RepID=UPI003313AE4A